MPHFIYYIIIEFDAVKQFLRQSESQHISINFSCVEYVLDKYINKLLSNFAQRRQIGRELNMSTLNYCRLCFNIGLDFKCLYDEHSQSTEVYDLAAKYFDQSILSTNDAKQLSMICFQCWEHIWDFNNFQQAVLVAQSNLDVIRHTEISPVSSELPCANVLQELQQQTSSAKVKSENCEESEENALPPTEDCDKAKESTLPSTEEFIKVEAFDDPEELINANHIVAIAENVEDTTNVDLTLEKNDMHQEEQFDDPVGLVIGSEFGNLSDIDSGSNSALCQFSIREISEISSASETNSESPNHGHDMNIYYRQANLILVDELSTFFNHAEKSGDEKFKKFTFNRSYMCFFCVEKCFGLKGLFMHSNRTHSTEPAQIICCKQRHKGIPSISKHLTFHYNSPLLFPRCEACGKTFSTKPVLNRHILKSHNGWIP